MASAAPSQKTQYRLEPQQKEAALMRGFEVVLERIREEDDAKLTDQAQRAWSQILDARFVPL